MGGLDHAPDMNEDGFRIGGIRRLANAGQEHSHRLAVTIAATVEMKTVSRLRALRKLINVSPELCRILKRRELIIEVSAGEVQRFRLRPWLCIDAMIKHSSGGIEFEQPKRV